MTMKVWFRSSFVALLLAGVVLGGVGSSAEVLAARLSVRVGGVCVREGARDKVAGKQVVCVLNVKKQLRWRLVKETNVKVVTDTTSSTSVVSTSTTVAPTTTSTSTSSTTSTTSTSVVVGDRTAPVVTLGRSSGSAVVATLTFTVTGNEPIRCSTLSSSGGVDFVFTRISLINSIVQTTADVCTISAQSTAEPGDTNPRESSLAAASTFSVSDTAGNTQTVLSGSPQTIWVQRIARPVIALSATTETAIMNVAMNGYTITSSGGTVASYSLTGTLPAGLSFSTTTGRITGTPTATQTATTYTITATNTSGSTTATFTLTVVRSCADGGACIVGNTGPGGGIVFYVQADGGTFTCGATLASTCKYLEAAPTSGTAAWTDATYAWSGNVATAIGVAAQGTVIGTGLKNTLAMETDATRGANRAGTKTRDYRGPNSLTDWYLPSKDELNELCKYARTQTTGDTALGCAATGTLRVGFNNTAGVGLYWSSSETGSSDAWGQQFGVPREGDLAIGAVGGKTKSQDVWLNVRPVRAFG